MKRVLYILLATVVMTLALAGCGGMEEKAYVFKCVDEDGNPLKGVSLQVCSDSQCMLFETEANGEAVCKDLPEMGYEVHVLFCPDGYSYDSNESYTTSSTYETHTFTLTSN